MKHITYTPSSDEYDYLEGSKDTLIFHNIIIVNFYALTLDEFKNSFNDIDEPKYLNSDYKEKVVRAYLENQREFPNEDLMYFDRELSDFEKILVVKYSKNKKMIELLSQDENHSIREVVAFRKDLPKHIVDNFIVDPVASVRESVIVSGRPLSKEQLKLFAKDTDRNIARVLLSSQNVKIDDELIDYFVKNGSFIVKEVLCGAIPDLNIEEVFVNLINSINDLNYDSKDVKKALIKNDHIPQYLREHLMVALINSNDYYDDDGERLNIDDHILNPLYLLS